MTDTYRILGLAGRGALEGEPGDHEPFLADIVIEADHEPDLTAVAAAAGGAIAPPARSLTERAERIAAAVHASGGSLAGVVVVLNRPEASLGVPVQAVEVTISRPGAQPRGVAPAGEAPGWGVPAPAAVAPTPPPAPVAPPPAAPAPVSPAPAPVREQVAPVVAQPAAAASAASVAPAAVPPAPQPPRPTAPDPFRSACAADLRRDSGRGLDPGTGAGCGARPGLAAGERVRLGCPGAGCLRGAPGNARGLGATGSSRPGCGDPGG
ncbi:hypothetical protein [Salana multivorans]